MVKGFGRRSASAGTLFSLAPITFQKGDEMSQRKEKENQDIVAHRRSCKENGAGISHYILMDKKAK